VVGGVAWQLVSKGRSLIGRENTPEFERPSGIGVEFPELFRGDIDEFPAIKNREFIPTSREYAGLRREPTRTQQRQPTPFRRQYAIESLS
jgi:hypothetical protein